MPYQVGIACYPTLDGAAAAVASAETGKVLSAGSVVYLVDAAAVPGGSITYTLNDAAGVQPAIVQSLTPTIPECALMDWSDGLTLGWGVAAVWVVAFALLAMRKGV